MRVNHLGTSRGRAFPVILQKIFLRRALPSVLFLVLGAHLASAEVRYVIALISPERHLVQVTMEIPPGAHSHELQLPVWNALYQVRDFSQYMNWIKAENVSDQPLPLVELNKSRWRIDGADRGARIVYEMFSNDPGSYGAQLNPHHAFFNLAEILLYAADLRNEPASVEIANVPREWKVATPLSPAGQAYSAPNYDRLVDSPVEIGTFEEQDFEAACGKYRVVLDREDEQGGGTKSDAILASMIPPLKLIVSTASAWMNDCPLQSYMFIYLASEGPGGGMEHAYSTAITLPPKDFDPVSDRLLSFTSHEFFHLWNVKRIRPRSLEPVDYTKENYTTALWFSEGVDSTVGEYVRLRAHLLDEQHYLNHLSEEITDLESRPAHLTQSVEQSSIDAWLEKYPYYGLPERSISYYNKGELLGVLLDLAMRDASKDRECLRELFRWMNEHYAKQGKFFADSAAIREAAETISHANLRDFFDKYVAGTEEIPWDKFFARVGLHVARTDVATAPGEILHLSIARAAEEQDLEWRLGSRKQTVFLLRDLPNVTPQQRDRRAAWLFGEGEKNSQ